MIQRALIILVAAVIAWALLLGLWHVLRALWVSWVLATGSQP